MIEQPRDRRQFAAATQRNREPILQVLQRVLPPEGTVLELASGTGEHGAFFAPRLAPRFWLPSDPNPLALESIEAWRQETGCDRLLSPLELNACESEWTVERMPPPELEAQPIQAMVCINMIHIAPWQACLGLLAGAGRLLLAGGVLYLYGPYKENGQHTSPSNEGFDLMLRDRDSSWGVRDQEAVIAAAEKRGLRFREMVEMPANNRSLVFGK
ncbi:DUF938 domain-containing protein [Sodalinema gerasimenkoae]|uniref:DUF938 domain-containing protein n=1 Tax=Sodalinema gerasimenkoae TaxID=2862348 RepID=UPI00186586FD|nr:DUF938 domain-containing protein [Sodalinema gerasimenkoae]